MDSRLYGNSLFTTRSEFLETDERISLAYRKAREVMRIWRLSIEDIGYCSQRFWDYQAEPIFATDGGMSNILACHVNLFLGTLAPLVRRRPYLKSIIEKGLRGDFFGNMLLTEVDHGLDILNVETTATKVDDGFVLHTPHPGAAKFMPPTTPIDGFPKMAIVLAKLIVDGEEHGIHPFLVATSDEKVMRPNITSRRLPPRSGSSPLDFAVTTFNNVRLPSTAFLGTSLEKPADRQALLHRYIWRIGVGTGILAMYAVSASRFIACIGADYSFRRHVQGKAAEKIPIISFRTQQLPVLYATAVAHVFRAWQPRYIEYFMSQDIDPRSRHGMTVVFKATVIKLFTKISQDLGERLGAQGLFGHNMISQMEMDNRGMSIAEGDVMVLSIRLFSELLLQRYSLPQPSCPQALLTLHSAAIFSRSAAVLATLPKGHRDLGFNQLVLPQSEAAVTALGHAFAYSAALNSGVPKPLLDLFELAVIRLDEGWYAAHVNLSPEQRIEKEDRAVAAALPHLKEYIDALDVRKYVTAPIKDDGAWKDWFQQLKSHHGKEQQLMRNPSPLLTARL